MSDWKKTKAMLAKYKKSRIPLTEAELNLIKYLRQKNKDSK